MYQFPDEIRTAIESMPLPLAYFQRIEDKIIPLLVSDGLCRMMGADRGRLMYMMTNGIFDRVHPEDAGRIKRIVEEFAAGVCGYDVIYRSRYKPEGEYHIVHSIGRHQTAPDGTRLALFEFSDISESQSERNMLVTNYTLFQKDQFYTDPITGLPNINYLNEFAEERISRITAGGKPAALLYFDVRSLRSYNNQYGYTRGDDLLRLVADVMREEYKKGLVARGAEDHFIVIAAESDTDQLCDQVESINQKIKTGSFGNSMGIQAGVCVFDPPFNIDVVLPHARHALKQIGNDLNRVCAVYTHETDEQYWNQQYILESFDTALEQGWIKIYYQPIMRVKTGKAAALEALARWVDPERGIISPGEFIPVLEKYHLLYRLDLYMVEEFLKEFSERARIGLPLIPVSVNFAAQDFDHADVVTALNDLFRRYNISKENIIIELTEQDVAKATARFKKQLHDLRANGYRLWLDDFGSGYSSLNVLSQIDVDILKIDMDFLRHLDDHKGANRHIMKSIVDVARQLGVRTLVEGMETEEHLKFLKEINCEFAQGFYYYKPESLAQVKYKIEKGGTIIPCENPEERKRLRLDWESRHPK